MVTVPGERAATRPPRAPAPRDGSNAGAAGPAAARPHARRPPRRPGTAARTRRVPTRPEPGRHQGRLVEDLARDLGGDAAKIDPQIAFLTLDRDVRTPFARTLRVLHSAPWHEKQFAKRLRELDVGAVDIRRRGLAGDVDQIRRRLKLAGKTRATIVITRVKDKPWGLICADP